MNKKSLSGYLLILNYLGIFLILIGLINLVPLFLIVFWPQEANQAAYFLWPGLTSIIVGGLITLLFQRYEKGRLERHQDAVLVVSIWILAIFISSLPFLLSGQYSFTQSVFEATSGYSTTGLTVVAVEEVSHIFLLFRSLLQFFGGVGLVLVLTSAISDKFGMRLYSAEGHSDKLMPNLIRSARMILSIYVGYIIVGTTAYVIFGMPLFDALNHSICAVATGGFSTKTASIGHFNSLPIEIITMVLMILGGTNFFVHLMLLRGKIKNVVSHIEIKFLGILSLIFIPILVINIVTAASSSLGDSLRIGVFQFLTAITGTGYQTIPSFTMMPTAFVFGIIILMVLGAGMGSTAGGMKQYRVALALKSQWWNLKVQLAHKKTIRTHFVNRLGTKMVVEKEDIIQNYAFLITYMLVLIAGTMIFTAYGHSLRDAMFEFASALGTVGLSVGIVHAGAPGGVLWASIVGMFLGRLEFYVVFIAASKLVLDINKKKMY